MKASKRMVARLFLTKLMKQRLRVIFILAMSIMVSIYASAYVEVDGIVEVNGIYYILNDSTKEAKVTSRSDKYEGDIVIPSSIVYEDVEYRVTSIRESAFSRCTGLTSIIMPNSVKIIEKYTFYDCYNLSTITMPDSLYYIEESAFSGCESLTSIILPDSLEYIYSYAFAGCSSLTSINIPPSLKYIGGTTFCDCISLTSIVVDTKNPVFDSRDNCNAIIESSTNTLTVGCKSTIIPNSVTRIGNYAFYKCTGLTSITLPNSVTRIGNYAFYQCKSLTSVTIPDSVASIGEDAFRECSSLSSVCLGKSVTNIDNSAFKYCTRLSYIKCMAKTPPSCGYDVFFRVSENIPVYVLRPSVDAYKEAKTWKNFTKIEAKYDLISVSSLGIASYCINFGLDLTGNEDIKAYVASDFDRDNDAVILTRVYTVPEYTGFLIKADAGEHIVSFADVIDMYTNLFVGTTDIIRLPGIVNGYSNYVLSKDVNGNAIFKRSNGGIISANTAYLSIPTSDTESLTINIKFPEEMDDDTGINDIIVGEEREETPAYNLSGQRISTPKRGLYIKNGRLTF